MTTPSLNLQPPRGPNVWDRASAAERASLRRRVLVIAVGGALVVYGRKGNAVGRILATAGAALVSRALAGHDDLKRVDAWWSARHQAPDHVERESRESFPASDAPSWTPTTATSGA